MPHLCMAPKWFFQAPSLMVNQFVLITSEKVNQLMGVPTVWLDLLNYTEKNNIKLESVNSVLVGGSAAPKAMIKAFQEKHDCFLLHGWGMTEMSPLGTLNSYTPEMDGMDLEERYEIQTSQGRAVYGCSMKIINDEGKVLPNDGKRLEDLWSATCNY